MNPQRRAWFWRLHGGRNLVSKPDGHNTFTFASLLSQQGIRLENYSFLTQEWKSRRPVAVGGRGRDPGQLF